MFLVISVKIIFHFQFRVSRNLASKFQLCEKISPSEWSGSFLNLALKLNFVLRLSNLTPGVYVGFWPIISKVA